MGAWVYVLAWRPWLRALLWAAAHLPTLCPLPLPFKCNPPSIHRDNVL